MVDESRIQQTLESISFPRIYGSEAEKKAYQIAKSHIEKLNLTATTQEFSFTNFYAIFYNRIMFALVFWLLFVLYLNIGGYFQAISLLSILGLFIYFTIISRKPEEVNLGKRFNSQNVYTKINSESLKEGANDNKKEIVFMAHLDSKSQRFDVTDRVRIISLWLYSLLLTLVFIIFKNIFFPQYAWLFYLFGGVALSLNVSTLIYAISNSTFNESPGALDDGSGVAIVLELLNYYANVNPETRLKNLNLWFVLTGAEEGGTMGIRNFYKKIQSYGKDDLIVMNFDAIGTRLDFIKFGVTSLKIFKLRDYFLQNAENYNLDVKSRKVPVGVHTDGYYLFKKGYRGLELGDWDCYQYIHSVEDSVDKVNCTLLKNVCEIVIKSLEQIDEYYNN